MEHSKATKWQTNSRVQNTCTPPKDSGDQRRPETKGTNWTLPGRSKAEAALLVGSRTGGTGKDCWSSWGAGHGISYIGCWLQGCGRSSFIGLRSWELLRVPVEPSQVWNIPLTHSFHWFWKTKATAKNVAQATQSTGLPGAQISRTGQERCPSNRDSQ